MNTYYIQGSTAVEVAEAFEAQIRAGEIPPGVVLPSVRRLAQEIGLSPNTVASAYALLRDAGLVMTDGRRGTRVAMPPVHHDLATLIPEGLKDLASGNVDSSLLPKPRSEWFPSLAKQAGYEAEGDAPQLLAVMKNWQAAQGIPSSEIGVFSGALDAIEYALRMRARPGNRVLVEDPCWPPLRALIGSMRLKPTPLAMDAEGISLPDDEELKGNVALIITPRAQNPTGASLSAERWAALQERLHRHPDILLILDDHWGPLSLSAPPCPINVPNWLYVLSTSKFLGPDLRISLATGTPALIQDMRRQQALGPRWVSLLLQNLAAHLWQDCLEHDQLQIVRTAYARRSQLLAEALMSEGFGLGYQPEGLHMWLPVADETSMVQAMGLRGWAVQAGTPFRILTQPAIRVSIGNLDESEIPALARDIALSIKAPRRQMY